MQTYGPFVAGHIISAEPHQEEYGDDTYQVWWTITVDNNGDPGTVEITSRSGTETAHRNETRQMTGVDVRDLHDRKEVIRGGTSDIILVNLSDASPARAGKSREFRITTPERKQPKVTVSKGTDCSDSPGSSLPPATPAAAESTASTPAAPGSG